MEGQERKGSGGKAKDDGSVFGSFEVGEDGLEQENQIGGKEKSDSLEGIEKRLGKVMEETGEFR